MQETTKPVVDTLSNVSDEEKALLRRFRLLVGLNKNALMTLPVRVKQEAVSSIVVTDHEWDPRDLGFGNIVDLLHGEGSNSGMFPNVSKSARGKEIDWSFDCIVEWEDSHKRYAASFSELEFEFDGKVYPLEVLF